MTPSSGTFLLLLVALLCPAALADVRAAGDAVALSGPGWEVSFSTSNGAITAIRELPDGSPLMRSAGGLWCIRFQDGSELDAADFSPDSQERIFGWEAAEGGVRLTYTAAEADVTVTATARERGPDLRARVTPHLGTVLDLALPAALVFEPESVERLVFPGDGNQTVGTAFRAAFFQAQPDGSPAGWSPQVAGPDAYRALYGDYLDQREDDDPPVPLQVTAAGRAWLGEELAARADGKRAVVNRPPTRTQADIVLVDSANGPYLSGCRLGGDGMIWRIGGGVGDSEAGIVSATVAAVVGRLAGDAAAGRRKVGLLSMERGPLTGGWSAVKVADWRRRLAAVDPIRLGRVRLVEITDAASMLEAMASNEYVGILNPYGEWVPVTRDGGMQAAVEAVGAYVRAGGNWLEVGGYPFYAGLVPNPYHTYELRYPAAFADFMHLDSRGGSVSIYGVQPRTWEPWAGAADPDAVFVPGRLSCGGGEQGGWCERGFATYVPAGSTWISPVVRLGIGRSAPEALASYCAANGIERRLEDKMGPEVLERFKAAPLVYLQGSAADKTKALDLLPAGSLIHFADYLKGGFDKEYPDHLPPHPGFGTGEEMGAFFERARELGHLVMPYTNPTWWCDHPRGPTFLEHGEAPLLKTLDGGPSHERYGANDGFTVSHWHPAVQAANRKTVRQFTQDYPVDVLFQDQCGARGWSYDTNPASPGPSAYTEGLLSMIDEDARLVPLSTESGWDRVVNAESQLCGMTWSIVPTEWGPAWRRFMKDRFPPHTWDVFPVAQYIAHDKCAMIHHDLGQFVTNREVLAWTLALGYGMSYRIGANELAHEGKREWLRWLDRLQKSVCARYIGEPINSFAHDRGAGDGDGVIRATYGPVRLVANLDAEPHEEGNTTLPGFGFHVEALGLFAGNLEQGVTPDHGGRQVSLVVETGDGVWDAWVYAQGGRTVPVAAPGRRPFGEGAVLTADDGGGAAELMGGRYFLWSLPLPADERPVAPPPELAGMAPIDWPAGPPGIGIIDMPGMRMGLTRITPAQWAAAVADRLDVPVKGITSAAELAGALRAGATEWLVIVNPYGETFPVESVERWGEMLDLVANYVANGGNWWETGGYSFYSVAEQTADGWRHQQIGPGGTARLGLSVGGGPNDQPADLLEITPDGRRWLGDAAGHLADRVGVVNRALARGWDDPGHETLISGGGQDYIGCYRLNGWGRLWRIGGFLPDAGVALPAAAAVTERLYTRPPDPAPPSGIKRLWHATIKPAAP